MQVAEGTPGGDMVDVVFMSWPLELGIDATKLLDAFLIHGAEPGMARAKVAELFSPPRVTAALGVLPGFAALAPGSTFDLRADSQGRSWDFLRADHRHEARRQIEREGPYMVIGSPPCTDFSILFRNCAAPQMNPAVVRRRRVEAEILLGFAAEIYQYQLDRGNHFLHEHPLRADSWAVQAIARLRRDPRVGEVTAHQCAFGQTSVSPGGRVLPVRKATRFLSSAPAVLEELNRQCTRDHEHQPLVGGRAAAAAVYPAGLCRAILRGINRQRLREAKGPPWACPPRPPRRSRCLRP